MKTTSTIFLILLAASTYLKAQEVPTASTHATEEKKIPMRMLGLGLKTFNLLSESAQSPSIIPGNRLILTYTPHRNVRFQPEFGYYKTKQFNEQIKDDLIAKSTSIGGGIYGMWQKGKTNLYAGVKYIFTQNYYELMYTDYSPVPPYNITTSKLSNSNNVNSIGIVLGGEYFLGPHFSVGSEIGFMRLKGDTSSSDPLSKPTEFFSSMTESNLLFRFYF